MRCAYWLSVGEALVSRAIGRLSRAGGHIKRLDLCKTARFPLSCAAETQLAGLIKPIERLTVAAESRFHRHRAAMFRADAYISR